MRPPLEAPSLNEIRSARQRIADWIVSTPLLRLHLEDAPAEIYLKLENLQPIGSFKLRGAGNAMAAAAPELLKKGVYTASAGNMAQGVAWNARRMGVPCTAVVPDHAPQSKLQAIRRMGGKILPVPYEQWWDVILKHRHPGQKGIFIHPVSNREVMAGNGTIGLEIAESLDKIDTVLVPFGGGGLSCGISSALRPLSPSTAVYACEVETAAPLAASLQAGSPQIIDYQPSFVDGAGGKGVLDEMWPLIRKLIKSSLVVSLEQTAAAVRLLAERHRIIVEGAGALSLAAALSGQAGSGRIVCIISGGNIDASRLCSILSGEFRAKPPSRQEERQEKN